MVELNSTIFPILGSIDTFVNTVKVFVGGVFGIYLVILYIKVREYTLMRRMYKELKSDIRAIADKQHVKLEPTKPPTIVTISHQIKQKFTRKKTNKKAKKK